MANAWTRFFAGLSNEKRQEAAQALGVENPAAHSEDNDTEPEAGETNPQIAALQAQVDALTQQLRASQAAQTQQAMSQEQRDEQARQQAADAFASGLVQAGSIHPYQQAAYAEAHRKLAALSAAAEEAGGDIAAEASVNVTSSTHAAGTEQVSLLAFFESALEPQAGAQNPLLTELARDRAGATAISNRSQSYTRHRDGTANISADMVSYLADLANGEAQLDTEKLKQFNAESAQS